VNGRPTLVLHPHNDNEQVNILARLLGDGASIASALDEVAIVVATKGHPIHKVLQAVDTTYSTAYRSAFRGATSWASDDSKKRVADTHIVHSIIHRQQSNQSQPPSVIVCAGATPRSTLYAVYSFLETCGARFHLHGDVLPEHPSSTLAFSVPQVRSPFLSLDFFCIFFTCFRSFWQGV
jgi:hypothetical protein